MQSKSDWGWRCCAGLGLLWASICGAQEAPAPAASAPPATGTAYRFDAGHTFVYWEVLHMDTSTIRGRFDRLDGHVMFDPAVHRLEVGLTVDVASVSTGSQAFDQVLRGASLLGTDAYPHAYFTARQARWEGEVPREVRGEITLHGVSRPLTLTTVRWKCGFNPLFRARVCGGDLEGTLARTDFDLHFGTPLVGNEVKLRIQVEAVPLSAEKPAAPTPP